MVKKVAKSTTSTVKRTVKKAAATVQKTLTKENKSQKLTNGHVKENPETKSDDEMIETTKKSNKEITDNPESERLSNVESGEAEEKSAPSVKEVATSSDKAVPESRKRKAASNVTVTKTRTKKQKSLFKIPEISTVIGKVFVVGDNSVGQLGFNTDDDIMEKKRPAQLEMPYSIVDVAAGGMHSVCLTQTGEVITFGCNDEGALGREAEDGSEYIPRKVNIPERIVQISAGDSHTAALSESGQVYIWGNFRNNNGAMGLTLPDVKQPNPVKILDGIVVVKIASGSDHLSCLSNDGNVYTCGNGEVGQLGRVSEHASANGGRKGMSLLLSPQTVPVRQTRNANHITDVWTGSLATFLKSNNGAVYAFGLNNFGQLGVNSDQRAIWKPKHIETFQNKDWTQINGGQHHTLALDNKGLVYSLGRSEYGRLGLGENSEAISSPTEISSLLDKKCISISCGNLESFAIEDNGSVYSWGFGTNYQLGHGNDNDQYIPKLIEGNFYNSWQALKVSGGGQHALILAHPRKTAGETK